MTPRLGISFLAQARFDNLIRGAAKITKEVMKSHGCTFQFSLMWLFSLCMFAVCADGAEQEESSCLCEYTDQFQDQH